MVNIPIETTIVTIVTVGHLQTCYFHMKMILKTVLTDVTVLMAVPIVIVVNAVTVGTFFP